MNKDTFSSKDIKKQDVRFNVEPTLKDKLKAFWGKVAAFPLFRGKAKFITLGVTIVIIAAAILLPIFIPRIIDSLSTPPSPEEVAEEQQQVRKDTADVVNNIDPEASSDTQSTILSDLDAKISAAETTADKYYFISAKALATMKFGDNEGAIEILQPITGELRAEGLWEALVNTYSAISTIYEAMGDIPAAIEWMQTTIDTLDEAATATVNPTNVTGRKYFTGRLEGLQNP